MAIKSTTIATSTPMNRPVLLPDELLLGVPVGLVLAVGVVLTVAVTVGEGDGATVGVAATGAAVTTSCCMPVPGK